MASVEDHGLPLLDVSGFHKHVSTLTASQKEFVVLFNDWIRGGRKDFLFVILTGGPGCGKTHAVVETLRYYAKLAVTKMSFTARLARRIGGNTVHSTMDFRGERGLAVKEVWEKLETTEDVEECLKLSARLDENMCCRDASDVVVIDEIGMLPFWLTYRIGLYFRDRYPVEKKRNKPVALICMGDDLQLKPVMSRLSVFHVDYSRWYGGTTKCIEMKESKRFTPQYEIVVNRLRELMKIEVVNEEEDDHPLFQYVRETYPIATCVTQEMMMRARFILAFTNESVDAYNEFYLNTIMSHEKEYKFPVLDSSGKRVAANDCPEKRKKLRKNCSVVVTENGCGEDIFNGTTLKFLDYDRMKDEAICQDEQTKKITRVCRSRYKKQIPLVPGFAVTIHKFQGATIDEDGIIVSFDKSKDFNLIYTALSRVRDMSQIIAVVLD